MNLAVASPSRAEWKTSDVLQDYDAEFFTKGSKVEVGARVFHTRSSQVMRFSRNCISGEGSYNTESPSTSGTEYEPDVSQNGTIFWGSQTDPYL